MGNRSSLVSGRSPQSRDSRSVGGSSRKDSRRLAPIKHKHKLAALMQAIDGTEASARRKAIKDLSRDRDPAAIPDLIRSLQDEDHDVRWAAAEALCAFDQAVLDPLLRALMTDFDSIWLREGAHHILNVLHRDGKLSAPLLKVLKALENVEPEIKVPWAAEAAWEAIHRIPKEKSGVNTIRSNDK